MRPLQAAGLGKALNSAVESSPTPWLRLVFLIRCLRRRGCCCSTAGTGGDLSLRRQASHAGQVLPCLPPSLPPSLGLAGASTEQLLEAFQMTVVCRYDERGHASGRVQRKLHSRPATMHAGSTHIGHFWPRPRTCVTDPQSKTHTSTIPIRDIPEALACGEAGRPAMRRTEFDSHAVEFLARSVVKHSDAVCRVTKREGWEGQRCATLPLAVSQEAAVGFPAQSRVNSQRHSLRNSRFSSFGERCWI